MGMNTLHQHIVCMCLLMIMSADGSTRGWSPPTATTNPIYANGTPNDGVTMTENPAYLTHVDVIMMEEGSTSATNPTYANRNPNDALALTENPAYVLHTYAQVYPTLSARPRPAPFSHPNTYNTSNSTSDHDYI